MDALPHPAAALEALRVDVDELVLAHDSDDQEVDEGHRGDERGDDAEGQAQQQRNDVILRRPANSAS